MQPPSGDASARGCSNFLRAAAQVDFRALCAPALHRKLSPITDGITRVKVKCRNRHPNSPKINRTCPFPVSHSPFAVRHKNRPLFTSTNFQIIPLIDPSAITIPRAAPVFGHQVLQRWQSPKRPKAGASTHRCELRGAPIFYCPDGLQDEGGSLMLV